MGLFSEGFHEVCEPLHNFNMICYDLSFWSSLGKTTGLEVHLSIIFLGATVTHANLSGFEIVFLSRLQQHVADNLVL